MLGEVGENTGLAARNEGEPGEKPAGDVLPYPRFGDVGEYPPGEVGEKVPGEVGLVPNGEVGVYGLSPPAP
jgi:hypothetical protein